MSKQHAVSDILYSKKKSSGSSATSSTVTSSEGALFQLGMNSQAEPVEKSQVKSEVSLKQTVNVNVNNINVKTPVLNVQQGLITVSPVINLHASDLVQDEHGNLNLLAINVALTININ